MAVGTYKRMFHRWEILRGWIPALIFAAIVIAIELLFFNYMVARGLPDESYTVSLGLVKIPLSIAFFLSLGNAIFLLVLWMTLFENTAYVMAGPDRRVRRVLYPLRMIRAAALVLTPFTIILFIPYVLESIWFINWIAGTSLQQSAISFYNWSIGFSQTDPSVKFVASQLAAAFTSVVVTGLQIWRVKGTRNLTLLLRRKK